MSLPHDGRMRYTLTLRVFKLNQRAGGFQFTNHLEQVADWEDSLIVDMGPDEYGTGLSAWVAWKSAVNGANDTYDPITNGLPADQQHPTQPTREEGGDYVCRIPLPRAARALPILGEKADIKISVHDRQFASARLVGQSTSG
jgi:hypothetical protein